MCDGSVLRVPPVIVAIAYLHAVHFEFADNLDRHLAGITLQIACPVDVAEGAVAHLLHKFPPLQAGVPGKLAPAGILLGDQLRNVVYARLLTARRLAAKGLLVFDMVGRDTVSAGCSVHIGVGIWGGRVGVGDGLGGCGMLAVARIGYRHVCAWYGRGLGSWRRGLIVFPRLGLVAAAVGYPGLLAWRNGSVLGVRMDECASAD